MAIAKLADQRAPQSHHNGRKRVQFSILSLLVSVFVLACVVAWSTRQYRSLREERAAASYFKTQHFAKVFSDTQNEDGVYATEPRLDARELVSNSIYKPITRAIISDANIDDVAISHLRVFRSLRDLKIQHSTIAPSCNPFSDLSTLERIDVRGTALGIDHAKSIVAHKTLRTIILADIGGKQEDVISLVCQLQNLEELAFEGLRIPNVALKNIGRMKSLRRLYLRGCSFEADILNLTELSMLESLDLSSTAIRDETIISTRCPQLESLSLDDCAVTDVSLLHISRYGKLWHLALRNSLVTDNGVGYLTPLQKLRKLDVTGSVITVKVYSALDQIKSLDRQQVDTGFQDPTVK